MFSCAPRVWGLLLCTLAVFASAQAGEVTEFIGSSSPRFNTQWKANFTKADSKIAFSSIEATEKPANNLFRGTIYYMVFKRDTENPRDPWGTGVEGLASLFQPGTNLRPGLEFSTSSPELDDRATYLYVYQVINPEADAPIETVEINLVVDFSEITSWGHFQGAGFATMEKGNLLPLSANHKPGARAYVSPAPATPVSQGLRMVRIPSARDEVRPKEADNIVQVVWDALDPALSPTNTFLMPSSKIDPRPNFHASWSGKNALPKDGRSTVFGFTSNRPPKFEPARLYSSREFTTEFVKDLAKAKRINLPKDAAPAEAFRLVGLFDAGEMPVQPGGEILGIEGKAPTPAPPVDVGASILAKSAGATFSPNFGIPSNAPPIPATSGGGSATTSAPPISNFGQGQGQSKSSGGGFSGSGSNTSTQPQQASNINIKIDNVNQQQQQQQQKQSQSGSQKQNQGQTKGGGGGGNVVPEPASLLAGLLGLPAVWVAWRRRQLRTKTPEA